MNCKKPILRLALLCLSGLPLAAQTYQVRPEWVRAHEDFLASDALQGRGSATRDEQIAATYIASQFESFGLKPLPVGYVQPIELESFTLDGKAQLKIGKRLLHEGADFYIVSSSGGRVTGNLQLVPLAGLATATPVKDAAVLIRGDSATSVFRAMSPLQSKGARLMILQDSKAVQDIFQPMGGGKTRVPTRIKGIAAAAVQPPTAVVVLKSSALPRLRKAKNGAAVSLTLQSAPSSKFTYNAMAMLPGGEPSGETILITAHLDHLGLGAPNGGDSLYNGANDDASGVTAVLEIARALAAGPAPRRNVLFICFGSEEAGGYGARWFRENPPFPLKDILANLEFEMIGVAQDQVPKGTMFMPGWERSNLGPALKEHGARISPDPFPEQNFFRRSDNYALALKGIVAHAVAAGGIVPTYHKPNDDVQHIDIQLMTDLIQSMIEPLRWLVNTDFRPAWNPGGQPAGN